MAMRKILGEKIAISLGFVALFLSSSLPVWAATPQIAAGVASTMALKADGTVWGVGAVTNGGFGLIQPTRLFPDINDGIAISTAGADYVLRANGELWASGRNESGQAGDGTTDYRSTPYKVLTDVSQFDAQDNWAIALRQDGTVWTWGANGNAQLGDLNKQARLRPAPVAGLSNIIAVAAGSAHGFALQADGMVWGWGSKGSIPNGDVNDYLPDDPRNFLLPTKLVGLPAIASLKTGRYNTLFLDQTGVLWSYGGFWTGQLGDGSPSDKGDVHTPVKVAINGRVIAYSACEHDLALTSDGKLWLWGANTGGQLGLAAAGNVNLPISLSLPSAAQAVAAGWRHSVVLLNDGQVLTIGDDGNAQLGRGIFASSLALAPMIAARGAGTFNVYSPTPANLDTPPSISISNPDNTGGYNYRGKVPYTVNLVAESSANTESSIASIEWRTSDGQTVNGAKASFSFSRPGTVDIYAVATDSAGLKRADHRYAVPLPAEMPLSIAPQLVMGPSASLGLSSTGVLFGWGDPHYVGQQLFGKVWQGLTLPGDPDLHGIRKIALKSYNSMALTQSGDVLIWGANCSGSLGTGSTLGWTDDPVRVPLGLPAIDIAAGGNCQNAALLNDGSVWAWGANEFGELGQGDTAGRSLPVKIAGLKDVVQIHFGTTVGFAIDKLGQLWAWGDNRRYQLGQGTDQVYRGVVRVPDLPPITSVSVADGAVLAITTDGRVFGWGASSSQLGDPNLPSPLTKPALIPALAGFTRFAASSYVMGTKADGSVWTWGENFGGGMTGTNNAREAQPIPLTAIRSPLALSATPYGGAVVLQDGSVASWGLNQWGQIGDGSFARAMRPTLVSNTSATGYLSLLNQSVFDINGLGYAYFLGTSRTADAGGGLSATLTDLRATGFDGDIYLAALLPANSPLLPKINGFADTNTGTVPVTLGRGGVKQTGPGVAGLPTASGAGAISTGNQFAVYSGVDPLANSNAVICMGVTVPALSAKGQVLMRPIATGTKTTGVAQCPTVQTPATSALYRAAAQGNISNLSLTATVTPQAEDRGQLRQLYSWAVAPDGTQFMQTGPNQWVLMQEPMQPAQTLTVPMTGDITLAVVDGLNLSGIPGTLVYVGLGASWAEVRMLNKAGHYYTVQ